MAASAPDPGADRQAIWFVFVGPSPCYTTCRHLLCVDSVRLMLHGQILLWVDPATVEGSEHLG